MGAVSELIYSQSEYLEVPTSSLIHRKTAVADLYVRLPSDRMVCIAHKGAPIDVERINRFGSKNVDYLFVSRNDFASVVSDLVRGAEILGGMEKVPSDMKVAKFFSIAESVYSEILRLPVTDESLGRAIRLSQEIAESMRDKPDFAKLIRTVVGLGDEFAKHSLGTVVMSNLLATQMDWRSAKLLQPITNGAFFHDVGLKEIPEELRFKPRIEMTKDEIVLWETHPALGARLLSGLSFITPDVLRIVAEHHEVPNGTGFPGKLRLDRIFPMAKLVSLANVMAHDIFGALEQGKAFSLDETLQRIDHVYSAMYGADLSRAARRVFKTKDPKEG